MKGKNIFLIIIGVIILVIAIIIIPVITRKIKTEQCISSCEGLYPSSTRIFNKTYSTDLRNCKLKCIK